MLCFRHVRSVSQPQTAHEGAERLTGKRRRCVEWQRSGYERRQGADESCLERRGRDEICHALASQRSC